MGLTPYANHHPITSDEAVLVGRIRGVWGVSGDLKVEILSDMSRRFCSGSTVWTKGQALIVEHSRLNKGYVLVRFKGVCDRDQAQALVGAELSVPRSAVPPLPAGTYYYFQLIGMLVNSDDGSCLGTIAEVLETGSNDVYVVRRDDGKEVLVPALGNVVMSVDPDRGVMTVRLIEGIS